ncbi:MAG: tetratricopeptide repeat protein [Planctomycetota bacterium]|jgi:lipoprotein NlpI
MRTYLSSLVTACLCLALVTVWEPEARAQNRSTKEERAAAARSLVLRAYTQFQAGQKVEAIATMDRVLTLEPDRPDWLQRRGEMCFRAGRIKDSLIDFDRVVKLMPRFAPNNWQRGISLYYAGRYAEGRKQFESHQTVNRNDVENAVWHFICVTRESGLEEARKNLIPIRGDTRVPMAQIHSLFAGRGTPQQVIDAAKRVASTEEEDKLRNQMMYAHLYLGLYYEAIDYDDRAETHIELAATKYAQDHYMGDVAKVHHQILKKKPADQKE